MAAACSVCSSLGFSVDVSTYTVSLYLSIFAHFNSSAQERTRVSTSIHLSNITSTTIMASFRISSIVLAPLLLAHRSNAFFQNPVCSSNDLLETCDEETPLVVSSYEMLNGSNDNYKDDTYTGGPYDPIVPLKCGTGELTDGAIPTLSWSGGNAGPYVGFLRSQPPSSLAANDEIPITFKFTKDEIVSKVEISVDDPLPASSGGVTAPAKVIIDGIEYDFPANTSPQTGPYTASIELNDPIFVSAGGSLEIKLVPVTTDSRVCRTTTDAPCVWVFVSEVQFFQSCSDAVSACINQERAKCCKKVDSVCDMRRELQENGCVLNKAKEDDDSGGGRNLLITSCFWGDDVITKESTDLCLEECFAYAERLCYLNGEFGLLHECDGLWP